MILADMPYRAGGAPKQWIYRSRPADIRALSIMSAIGRRGCATSVSPFSTARKAKLNGVTASYAASRACCTQSYAYVRHMRTSDPSHDADTHGRINAVTAGEMGSESVSRASDSVLYKEQIRARPRLYELPHV